MPLGNQTRRTLRVTHEHLIASQGLSTALGLDGGVLIDGTRIDDFIRRSADTYIWHREPGAVYRESPLMRERMDAAGLPHASRLMHGALGLIHALQVAFARRPHECIVGVEGVRFIAPVFEGARLRVQLTDGPDGACSFEVHSDQLDPGLAISGQFLHGATAHHFPHETNLPERQLFSLEEALGLISALIGVSVEESGERVLYMGQRLELQGIVELADELEAIAEIVDRRPGKRIGQRVTAQVTVDARRGAENVPIASGESIFLLL